MSATALGALCLAAPALGADYERLQPGVYPANPVLASGEGLREPYDPFFDVDWSVALRGVYTKSTDGERFDTRLVPTVELNHVGTRSAIGLNGSAEIVRASEGQIDVSALRLSAAGGYALDSVTSLTGNANLSFTQAIAGTPGLSNTIAVAPETLSGGFGGGVTRQFGLFNIGVTGAVQRDLYGPTTFTDGTVGDNADQNVWSLDTALRVGYQVTPIYEVFGQAGFGRDIFDQASTTLLVKPDASDYSLRGGVTGRWNTTLEATASTGVALRRFDEASLGEVTTQLYDASVTYTPDPTLRFTAGFATTVAPPGPDAGGTTRIGYAATGAVDYTVNSWLKLNGLAEWTGARFDGSPDTETGYGLGAGADYLVNAHTSVNADYGFAHSNSTINGIQDAHQISVGVTLSR